MLKARLATAFMTKTRDEWCALLEGSDACFAPVLDWDEAPRHPHNRARGSFVSVDGVIHPAPAPRFSRTPAAEPRPATAIGSEGEAILRDWGISTSAIEALQRNGALGFVPSPSGRGLG